MRERPAQGLAQRGGFDQEIERIEPAIDGLGVGQRACEPFGDKARPRRGHGEVDRRQERALPRAAESPGQLQIGAGGEVDFEARPARPSCRGRERGARLELGALDIGQRQSRGGDLGAGESAEAVEGFDAVELAYAALGRRAVASGARERRRGQTQGADDLRKKPLVIDRLRGDDLARLEPRDLRRETRLVGFRQRECAGRQIERGEAVGMTSVTCTNPLHREENARPARLEQPLLGDRPGRDEPHDVAADDRFRSPLLRFRRIFELLADCDAMAERDQPVEIIVGALDRDAAHPDVLAIMLAALGEHDAERPARDLRVVEEKLVEVAHPIEEQGIGIGGLDLEILRHHRREPRARALGMGAFAGGVHR